VPHVGNVGINPEDVESGRPQVEGFIVRALSLIVSNWRSVQSLPEYLAQYGIPGIAEVDTRALTRHLRSGGVIQGCLSTLPDADPEDLIEKARRWQGLDGRDLVREVSCSEVYTWQEGTPAGWTMGRSKQNLSTQHYVLRMLWSTILVPSATFCGNWWIWVARSRLCPPPRPQMQLWHCILMAWCYPTDRVIRRRCRML